MGDTQWYVGEDPVIPLDGVTSTFPGQTRGEEVAVEGYIAGEADAPSIDTGSATVLTGAVARYDELQQHIEWAGAENHGTDVNMVPWYRERLPQQASIASNVLALRPGDGVDQAPSLWTLLLSASDSTRVFGTRARLSLSLFVLAPYGDYADRQAVSNALEETL